MNDDADNRRAPSPVRDAAISASRIAGQRALRAVGSALMKTGAAAVERSLSLRRWLC